MLAFLNSLLAWALSALNDHGYLIVFIATILENLFIAGSFTPGDVITAAAAFTATTPQGHAISLPGVFLCAAVGTWVGTNVSYLIGAKGGRALIERVGPRFGIPVEAIEASEEYFDRHGSPTIVFARFIAVMKNLAPTVAGASHMRLAVFEFYSAVGAIMYAGILVGVGWFLGANFKAGLAYFGAFSWILFAAVIVVGVVLLVGKVRHDRRVVAEEAAEFEAEHGRLECEDPSDQESDELRTEQPCEDADGPVADAGFADDAPGGGPSDGDA